MHLITKLFTAVRGSARESLEVVVDANALRIMDQEIHDTESAINRSKHDLMQVVAEKIRLCREITALKKSLQHVENKVLTALENDEHDIANEHAVWIAENESILRDAEQKHQQLQKYETDVKNQLKKAIRQMQHYRREWRMVKATASSQAASKRIDHRNFHLGSHIGNMEDSLRRIQHKQQDVVDIMVAREEVEDSLSDVFSGIESRAKPLVDSAASVLARIRQKKQAADNVSK